MDRPASAQLERTETTEGSRLRRNAWLSDVIDDALEPIEPRDELAFFVEDLDVGNGARAAGMLDLDQDAQAAARENHGGIAGELPTPVGSEFDPNRSRVHSPTS